MKKKLSLFFVSVFALSSFALAACTDKKEERELDSVEQYIVGTWKRDYSVNDNYFSETLIFNSDGTYSYNNYDMGQFKHSGNANSGELGPYEVISLKADKLAWFNSEPDKLFFVDTNGWFVQTSDPFIRQSGLTADDNDEQESSSITQNLIGDWQYYSADSPAFSILENDKYNRNGTIGKLKISGDAYDDLFGHYYEIQIGSNDITFRFYDFSDTILYIGHTPSYSRPSGRSARVLHPTETLLVGIWQRKSGGKLYNFTSNGTFYYNDHMDEFYISKEGTDQYGHYYLFKSLTNAVSLDWRVYDDDPDNAYLDVNMRGSLVATRRVFSY